MAAELVLDLVLIPGNRRARPARSRSRREAPPPAAPAVRGRELLERHIDLIQHKLRSLGRHSGLPDHEADEFCSWAMFRLVDDDYRLLASWQGRSAFSTYLTVVLVNLMRDYRIHLWGKWRPSAEARRHGAETVLLERLWLRDGLSLGEAIDRLQAERGATLSRAELERIAGSLPRRTPRRRVGEEELQRVGIDGHVEARVEDGERARLAARLQTLLLPRLESLATEDRLLFKLHYQDGLTVAAISHLLGRPQRELYSSRDRCLKQLRQALQEAGLDGEEICALPDGSFGELAAVLTGVWEAQT